MSDTKAEVREMVRKSKRTLKSISEGSGVSYFKLKRWFKGTTEVFDANDAAAVRKLLTEEASKA